MWNILFNLYVVAVGVKVEQWGGGGVKDNVNIGRCLHMYLHSIFGWQNNRVEVRENAIKLLHL